MNDTTRRYPRTIREAFGMSPQDAIAIQHYRTPLYKRVLFFWCRHGWLGILLGLLAALILEIA